jgi:hypothetical protein
MNNEDNCTEDICTLLENLGGDEIYHFEVDMEKGKYHDWVEKYPEHIYSIFENCMLYYGCHLKEEDVLHFIKKGLDLNQLLIGNYEDKTTPLHFACEYRILNLIEILIRNGSDMNKRDSNHLTPLESLLMGHRLDDTYKHEEAEKGVRILLSNGAKSEISHTIYNDYCEQYLMDSQYLKSFLNSCKHL